MKVINEINIYEIDEVEVKSIENETQLSIKSHWNYGDRIILKGLDNKEITVIASELIRAINNATNWK